MFQRSGRRWSSGWRRPLALLVALLVAGCGSSTATPGPATQAATQPTSGTSAGATTTASTATGGTFTIAATTLGDAALDPSRSGGTSFYNNDLLFDSIVGTSKDDTTISKDTGIAQAWTISADGKTYDFTIRQGVKFSDGTDVTAEDVKFTLDRLSAAETNTAVGRQISNAIASVTVRGAYQVEVVLKAPSLMFLEWLSRDGAGFVVPKAYIQKVGDAAFNQNPIGTGPYKVDKHQIGVSMELVPSSSSHFAVGTPPFQRIVERVVPEESTRVAMLSTGEANFIDVGTDSAAALKGKGFRIVAHTLQNSLALSYTGQLKDASPLRDINVRKALSLAIDRDAINKGLWQGLGMTTQSLFPGQIGGQPRAADKYDPTQAKALLAQAGYTDKKPLVVQLYSGNESGSTTTLPMLLAIQANWKTVGVQTDVIFTDTAVLRQKVVDKALPANAIDISTNSGRRDWSGNSILFTCKGLLSRICDPALGALFGNWQTAPTIDAYQSAARQTETYLEDHYYAYPVITSPTLYATDNDHVFMGGASAGLIHLRIDGRAILYLK